MAAREENTDLTQCPVCFEPYTETGEHIPRILPCLCTLCQSCILKLIKNQQLECPQDRQKHPARQEEKSFPQNKYILPFLRKEFQPKETDYDVCPEHKMKFVLFCKDEKCQKPICPTCITERHLSHSFESIIEKHKRQLNSKLELLMNHVYLYHKELKRAKPEIIKDCRKKIIKLTERKEEVIAVLDEEITSCVKNVTTLSDIREKIEKGSTHQELMDKLEFVNMMKDLCAEATEPLEVNFYELTKCKLQIEKAAEEVAELVGKKNAFKKKRGPVYITQAKRICELDFRDIREMEVLSDGSVVLGGRSDIYIYSMIRYDRDTGEILYKTQFKNWAEGMVEVNLRGKPTLAVSYVKEKYQQKSECHVKFYDVQYLYKSISEFQEDGVAMGKMCRRSDCVILGQDLRNKKNVTHINCAQGAKNDEEIWYHNKDMRVKDMCFCTDSGGEQIIVIVYSLLGALYAENVWGQVVWSIDGALGGDEPIQCISVTCDKSRHLFVCDSRNYCIECFSTNGLYLCRLVDSNNKHGIGIPERIKYCRKTSSLLVVHSISGEGRFLSELKIDYNQES